MHEYYTEIGELKVDQSWNDSYHSPDSMMTKYFLKRTGPKKNVYCFTGSYVSGGNNKFATIIPFKLNISTVFNEVVKPMNRRFFISHNNCICPGILINPMSPIIKSKQPGAYAGTHGCIPKFSLDKNGDVIRYTIGYDVNGKRTTDNSAVVTKISYIPLAMAEHHPRTTISTPIEAEGIYFECSDIEYIALNAHVFSIGNDKIIGIQVNFKAASAFKSLVGAKVVNSIVVVSMDAMGSRILKLF